MEHTFLCATVVRDRILPVCEYRMPIKYRTQYDLPSSVVRIRMLIRRKTFACYLVVAILLAHAGKFIIIMRMH